MAKREPEVFCPNCGLPRPSTLGIQLGDLDHDIWGDIQRLYRLAVVGDTAMAAGFDAAPFTDGSRKTGEAAYHRLRRRFDPKARE